MCTRIMMIGSGPGVGTQFGGLKMDFPAVVDRCSGIGKGVDWRSSVGMAMERKRSSRTKTIGWR